MRLVVRVLILSLASAAANAGSREVARDVLGEQWPLKVDAGTLECRPGPILTFTANGKTWAVNGTAAGQGYFDIEPIWKDNPENPGAKISIGPLIDLAKSLCEN